MEIIKKFLKPASDRAFHVAKLMWVLLFKNHTRMKTLFTLLFLGLLIGLTFIPPKIPNSDKIKERFNNELKKNYLAYKDSSEMRKEALRIYLPIAIKCNSQHKK